MKYHAFLSCGKADYQQAWRFQRALRRYRIPASLRTTKLGTLAPAHFHVFLPSPHDDPSSEAVPAELEQSEYLVVLCSRQSVRDPSVKAHLRAFKRLGRPHHILTIIVDGEPNAPDSKNECFPDELKYALRADGELDPSQCFEPIAADARPHKDGRHAVLLKIAAGLLGTGYDDLYRREERRQQRSLILILAASLILTGFLGAMATRALLAERESRRQLAATREVNSYIESLFANVDRSALQKMDPKLMTLVLDASEHELDSSKSPLTPDLEAQMRQTLGQAYLACGIWNEAVANLQRSLNLWGPTVGPGYLSALISRRDLGAALIGAGKVGEAREVLNSVAPSDRAEVRFELARALALTGDPADAVILLREEIRTRPQALADALRDPAFQSIRSQLSAPQESPPSGL